MQSLSLSQDEEDHELADEMVSEQSEACFDTYTNSIMSCLPRVFLEPNPEMA